MQRRRFLTTAGLAALGLAGCTADGDTDPGEGTTTDPGGTTTAPPTSTTPTTSPPTSTTPPTTEAPPDASPTNPSFEDDLAGWTVGTDLPADPGGSGEPVDHDVSVTDERASEGSRACSITISGDADDGTVWVQQPVDLTDVTVLHVDYLVTTSFNERMQAAVYTGAEPAEGLVEADFDTSKSIDGHQEAGWKTFQYDVAHDGEGVVAVGASVVWETEITALLDNVRLAMP